MQVHEILKDIGTEVRSILTVTGQITPEYRYSDDLDQEIYMYILEELNEYSLPLSPAARAEIIKEVYPRACQWCEDMHDLEGRHVGEEEIPETDACCEDPEVLVLRDITKDDLMELLEKCPRRERVILVQMAGLDDGIPDDREALLRYLHSKNFTITDNQLDSALAHVMSLLRMLNSREKRTFKYYYPF